ncbi:MAG: pyridoxamine 5'-phosphate oxidase family protein [Candidatus Dormiibacterota bacterium]
MPRKLTIEEREAFLSDLHVGVIAIAAEEERAPLALPIWYAYEPGGLVTVLTRPDSRKGRLLRAAGRCRLVVQDEAVPYRYVSVEGPIVGMGPDLASRDELQRMATRYLGEEGGAAYVADLPEQTVDVAYRMRPERWTTEDYSE